MSESSRLPIFVVQNQGMTLCTTVLVRGGLQPGDSIVSSLLPSAVEGMRVRVGSESTLPGVQNLGKAGQVAPVGGH